MVLCTEKLYKILKFFHYMFSLENINMSPIVEFDFYVLHAFKFFMKKGPQIFFGALIHEAAHIYD